MQQGRIWAVWAVVTVATVPASCVFWFVGGMGMCGEEVYDTPPGSVGYELCGALVEPVVPWALLAALPTFFAATLGFVAIRQGRRELFVLAALAPLGLVLFSVMVLLAGS